MRLLLTKILLLVSYSFLLAHTIVPHHHDDPAEAIQSHHDDGKDHNIFSFGQIDNSFLPSQKEVIKYNDCSSQFIPCLYQFTSPINSVSSDNEFPVFEEFPPPKNYFYSYSFRGPPIL
jgi:hypothetical protein